MKGKVKICFSNIIVQGTLNLGPLYSNNKLKLSYCKSPGPDHQRKKKVSINISTKYTSTMWMK